MSLRHTLLGLLDWVPMHGYALREASKSLSWVHPMNNTNIYSTLRSLEDDGHVVHTKAIHEGRLRKTYSVTDAGREELNRWLTKREVKTGTYRDEVLLRICLLRPSALEARPQWIEDELQTTREGIERTEALLDAEPVALPHFARLVAELARDLTRVRARFLEHVLEEVESQRGEQGASDSSR